MLPVTLIRPVLGSTSTAADDIPERIVEQL
jgi:hypothetical protein